MTDQNDNEKETPETPETPATPETPEPTPQPETEADTGAHQQTYAPDPEPEVYPSGIWMRALHMIIFMILFGVAETLLFFMAVFQFLWMLFTKKRNPSIAQFGDQISSWLAAVGRFQSGATDDKPFPWSDAK